MQPFAPVACMQQIVLVHRRERHFRRNEPARQRTLQNLARKLADALLPANVRGVAEGFGCARNRSTPQCTAKGAVRGAPSNNGTPAALAHQGFS